MARRAFSNLDGAAAALSILGALNWGLVGAFDVNPIKKATFGNRVAERAVYGVIGLSGLWFGIALGRHIVKSVRKAHEAEAPIVIPGEVHEADSERTSTGAW